jgi:uncharacterized protein
MNTATTLRRLFATDIPIIGMVHLLPLPGAPGFDAHGGMGRIIETAVDDAQRLASGGVDGIQIENQWDRPFLRGDKIGPETVSAMTRAVGEIKAEVDSPLGINVHLNGAIPAMAIAVATGCHWIRVFELASAYIASTGLVEGVGPDLMRYRRFLDATSTVAVFGDFHVKHGSHQITADRRLEEELEDVAESGADAAIVTGLKTGVAPGKATLQKLRGYSQIPIIIGSGLTLENLPELLPFVDGAIVGKHFKERGELSAKVDEHRVVEFMKAVRAIRYQIGRAHV